MSAPPSIRVLVVDDHEVVRKGIRSLLAATADLEVTAEAATMREAIDQVERSEPDVVVMDVRLANENGIEVTREIRARRPNVRVLMLSSFADEEAVLASILAGAAGYVLKQIAGDDLVNAIRAVAQQQNLLDPAVTKSVLDRVRNDSRLAKDKKLARLSAQEERVLSLITDGMTNKQIGEELRLSEKTVRNYVSTILGKLEVARRAEAAVYLTRHGGQLRI
jgi:two-component system, NarL family, response regulator DevR